MKRKVINLIQVLLVLVILWAGYKVYSYKKDSDSFQNLNDEYAKRLEEVSEELFIEETETTEDQTEVEAAEETEKDLTEEEKKARLAKAFMKNFQSSYPQVVGRILIKGLNLDFPIAQGEDNEFYLNHDYKNDYHPFGSVFMDARNSRHFDDQNTVIYGHNIAAVYIFHDLMAYWDPEFVRENPYVIIDTVGSRRIYRIFAVYQVEEYEDYRTPNYDKKGWEDLMERIRSKNILDENLSDFDDKILTLSTCLTLEDRTAIHAVLEKEI